MSSLSQTIGEGRGQEHEGAANATYTGYGTHAGAGNVRSHAEEQEGTGWDTRTGRVASPPGGRDDVGYDPVTGAAALEATTAGYAMPGQPGDLGAVVGGLVPGTDAGGMVDVSAPPVARGGA